VIWRQHPSTRHGASRLMLKTAFRISFFVVLVLCATCRVASAEGTGQPVADPRDDLSPWGVGSGAELLSAYPVFNPIMKDAGVKWLRGFYEWQTIQPKQGYWNFALPDALVRNARSNGLHVLGGFAYLAPWASADGGTRRFPIKDIQFWRDYVAGLVQRYHSDIKYWEVWNEFNGSFAENGTPAIYAELVREASIAAKQVDPTAKIGMSVANFDVGFLDAAIKAGAGGYFDYVCIHPYEVMQRLSDGGEPQFLNMATTLRKMLAANHQPEGMPLWITELGSTAPERPDADLDAAQGVSLVKAYVLAVASGFTRVFWFEARGPSYGRDGSFGLLRLDLTPRPSYIALKALTDSLGSEPTPAGWLAVGDGGYGFLFDTEKQPILVAWAPAKREINLTFDSEIRLVDLKGETKLLSAGRVLTLTDTPVLLTGLSAKLLEKARGQKTEPYPWASVDSRVELATASLGAVNVENGVAQVNPQTTIADRAWRRTDFSRPDGEGHYVYFSLHPQFAPFGARAFEITAVVRRVAPDDDAGMNLNYESRNGYVDTDYRRIPAGDGWHEITWRVDDANFVGAWGWNFRLNGISSPNEFLVNEIRVRRVR